MENIESLEKKFNRIKMNQELGIEDKTSDIVYEGITIPAGYLDNFLQVIHVLRSIRLGSIWEIIANSYIPNDLSKEEVAIFMSLCSDESERVTGIKQSEEVLNFWTGQYMKKQEKISQKIKGKGQRN